MTAISRRKVEGRDQGGGWVRREETKVGKTKGRDEVKYKRRKKKNGKCKKGGREGMERSLRREVPGGKEKENV